MKINLLNIPVYYINLSKDAEKKRQIESQLKELGFTNFKRFPGVYSPIKGEGCAKSHNRLLKKMLNETGPFLILEDDVIFSKSFKPVITVPKNADAVYLGNSAFGLYGGVGKKQVSAEKYSDELYRIYNMLAAHAILYLSKEYVDMLVRATNFMIEAGTNQDKARASTMKFFNVYAFNKPPVYQGGKHQPVTNVRLVDINLVGKEQSL